MSENKNTQAPTGWDAEFLSLRLGRVCARLGITQPFGDNHESNAEVAGTTLAAVDRAIELLVTQRDELAKQPCEWQRRVKHHREPGAVGQWENCSEQEATGHFEKSPYHEYRKIYALPPDADARIAELEQQRDTARKELAAIRQVIRANPDESTLDEVERKFNRLNAISKENFDKLNEWQAACIKSEQRTERAERALINAGFSYTEGADEWKPGIKTLPIRLLKRIAELESIVESMRDSQVDKLLAMTDEQVTALCRLEGSNPEDQARLGMQAMKLAVANVRITELEKQRDELLAALVGLHKVCEIALAGKDGKQHTYFETRAGHFVEATESMREAEAAIASVKSSCGAHIGSQAAKDVIAERIRQQTVEGWTPEHDDQHNARELSAAAECYAGAVSKHAGCPAIWPWDEAWWKPQDYRRNLVKAGALIIAEIERLDRLLCGAQAETAKNEGGAA